MTSAKILLVDDSAVIRGLLTKLIDGQPGLDVVGTASNGKMGVEKVRALDPDLVVLDIEMPVMTGLEAVVEIRKTNKNVPIVMFSTLTEVGADAAITALELGASDYATKPQSSGSMVKALEAVKDDLVAKINALVPAAKGRAAAAANRSAGAKPAPVRPRKKVAAMGVGPAAVVVGSSTGGPTALESFLGGLGQPLPVPMFIAQHMPKTFTAVLAKRLNANVSSTVVEATDGMIPQPGWCYIAPGGRHMALTSEDKVKKIVVNDEPPINSCRPSVEPLFETAADVYGPRLVAVMLTGMGADGVDGTAKIASLGCPVIVQDEATSVVWGMPGAVAKAGLANEILPLDDLGPRIAMLAGRNQARRSGGSRSALTGSRS